MTLIAGIALAPAVFGQQVTFAPYIQLGDNGAFGPTDQIVIAWQTDESKPKASAYKVEFQTTQRDGRFITPQARVIDNYLAADPSLPVIPGAYGAHSNYTAVLTGLRYNTQYQYRVTGPGMPSGGFAASFHTRKLGQVYSFVVVGDEGFFPTVPNSDPAVIVDYEARIAHLIHDTASLSVPGVPPLPPSDFILNTGDNVIQRRHGRQLPRLLLPVYNSDQDSNETGAPIIRSELFFPAAGNHDLGSTGVSLNLLADNSAPLFSGNLSGWRRSLVLQRLLFPSEWTEGIRYPVRLECEYIRRHRLHLLLPG